MKIYSNNIVEKFLHKLAKIFEVDLRSLAAMRVGIALVVLADLIVRSTDLTTFYTDKGVLPKTTLVQLGLAAHNLSLHLLNDSWQFQAFLFSLAFIFALMLLTGYKTRLASIVTWFMVISLQNRNPLILSGADQVLRLVLFLGNVPSLE